MTSVIGSIKFLLILLIFFIDLLLPVGIATGTLYALVVMFTLRSENNYTPCIVAIIGIIFTIVAFYLSPTDIGATNTAIINHATAIFLITGSAILVMKNHQDRARMEALDVLSTTDALTKVKNRLAFDEIIATEIIRAHRYQRELSLALIDIDHFKNINDTYGHDAGDKILTEVSSRFMRTTRGTDEIFRLGGDEFAILFIETDLKQAQKICERRHQAFTNDSDKSVPVTLSIGIAAVQPDDIKTTLYKRADEALYISKNLGRNRVSALPSEENRYNYC